MNKPLPLTTGRLALRRPAATDAAFIHRLVNDADWLRYIGDRGVHTAADAVTFINERLLGSFRQHGFGLWVVEPREGGAALGLCGLLKRDELEHVDVGYAFLPEARLRGYAQEAAAQALQIAAQAFGLTRVVAIVQPANAGSRRVLEKLGMQFEGMIDFNQRPTCLYGIDLPATQGAVANSSHTTRFAPPSAT